MKRCPQCHVRYERGKRCPLCHCAGWEDTARVKIKAAADRFPEFHWVGYTLTRAGAWEREEFN